MAKNDTPPPPPVKHECARSYSTESTRHLGDGKVVKTTMWWCLCGKNVG